MAYSFKQVSAQGNERGIDALDRDVFGKVGRAIRIREWPPTPFPLLPMHEKFKRSCPTLAG